MTLVRNRSNKHFFIFFSILVLLALLFFVAKRGIADIYAYQASAYVELWHTNDKIPPTKPQWQAAFNSLSRAISLVPNHPKYLESMAALYQWKILLESDGERLNSLTQSKLFLKKAIVLRPAWPYAWANYALVKQQLKEQDDEFYHAIKRALSLGKWETKVQMIIMQTTLPIWFSLDKHTQTLAVNNSFLALHNNASSFISLAKQHNVLSSLCGKLRRDDAVKRVCNNKNMQR